MVDDPDLELAKRLSDDTLKCMLRLWPVDAVRLWNLKHGTERDPAAPKPPQNRNRYI